MFETVLGWMSIVTSNKGIVRTTLPVASKSEALEHICSEVKPSQYSNQDSRILEAKKIIALYLTGKSTKTNFVYLDFGDANTFSVNVWQMCRKIPFAETRSYLWLAKMVGNRQAARAVGQVMARNPLPILIPCHRVILSSGKIGGFMGKVNRIDIKKKLITLESSSVSNKLYE